ncbi:hypothetical protein C2E23DRAFT_104109 [Lenzites betulinus]|nr:hypothetical protein C2E23DRAFT_104109 [Lenzites betulinus]
MGQAHHTALTKSISAQRDAERKEEHTRESALTAIDRLEAAQTMLNVELSTSRKNLRVARKRISRFPGQLAEVTRKARSRPLTFDLKRKGVYTARARSLARLLLKAGCAQTKVGALMRNFGYALGVSMVGQMSSHTVRRVVYEGGRASNPPPRRPVPVQTPLHC